MSNVQKLLTEPADRTNERGKMYRIPRLSTKAAFFRGVLVLVVSIIAVPWNEDAYAQSDNADALRKLRKLIDVANYASPAEVSDALGLTFSKHFSESSPTTEIYVPESIPNYIFRIPSGSGFRYQVKLGNTSGDAIETDIDLNFSSDVCISVSEFTEAFAGRFAQYPLTISDGDFGQVLQIKTAAENSRGLAAWRRGCLSYMRVWGSMKSGGRSADK